MVSTNPLAPQDPQPGMRTRKRNRPQMSGKPRKRIRKDALMAAEYVVDTSSRFFRLPLEIRHQIYDLLWRNNGPIATTQSTSKMDITAYFKTTDIPESMFFPQSRGNRPPAASLPTWLLTSKLFLREAVARFNFRSHWLLCPISSSGPYKRLPLTTIMIAGLAKSLSLGNSTFRHFGEPLILWESNTAKVTMHLCHRYIQWLSNLTDYLQGENAVEHLNFGLTYLSDTSYHCHHVQQYNIDLRPIERLAASLPRLNTVNITFFLRPARRNDPKLLKLHVQAISKAGHRVARAGLGSYGFHVAPTVKTSWRSTLLRKTVVTFEKRAAKKPDQQNS